MKGPVLLLPAENQANKTPAVSHTVTIPIGQLAIEKKMLEKISRYLDVTRSALLFGNKALLVEGLAESLLLPVIARHIVLKNDPDAWLRFKATVVVPIDGVDFLPYVEVLLCAYKGARIADRVVVITDADPSVEGNRKGELERKAAEFGAKDALHVYTNQNTLEHEVLSAGNEALLKKAFLSLHPRSKDDWTRHIENVDEANRPDAFLELISEKRTRKGDLAQEICACIEAGDIFVVPLYLEQAIKKIAEP